MTNRARLRLIVRVPGARPGWDDAKAATRRMPKKAIAGWVRWQEMQPQALLPVHHQHTSPPIPF